MCITGYQDLQRRACVEEQLPPLLFGSIVEMIEQQTQQLMGVTFEEGSASTEIAPLLKTPIVSISPQHFANPPASASTFVPGIVFNQSVAIIQELASHGSGSTRVRLRIPTAVPVVTVSAIQLFLDSPRAPLDPTLLEGFLARLCELKRSSFTFSSDVWNLLAASDASSKWRLSRLLKAFTLSNYDSILVPMRTPLNWALVAISIVPSVEVTVYLHHDDAISITASALLLRLVAGLGLSFFSEIRLSMLPRCSEPNLVFLHSAIECLKCGSESKSSLDPSLFFSFKQAITLFVLGKTDNLHY